jgi:competence protein ComEA
MRLSGLSRTIVLRSVALCAASLFLTGLSWGDWPDGPGKEATLRVCGLCHEPERAASLQQDKAGWEGTISNMVGRGMEINDADYAAVLGYLSKSFPAQEIPPLNINSATSIDLESMLTLTRKEAAAVIAYREKNGKFKALEDLKKVPGLDFAKLEARKDRIAF